MPSKKPVPGLKRVVRKIKVYGPMEDATPPPPRRPVIKNPAAVAGAEEVLALKSPDHHFRFRRPLDFEWEDADDGIHVLTCPEFEWLDWGTTREEAWDRMIRQFELMWEEFVVAPVSTIHPYSIPFREKLRDLVKSVEQIH